MNRVLLVDDDVEIVAVVTNYLSVEGLEVESVADKERGHPAFALGKHVLVVLDISLTDGQIQPGPGSIELRKAIG